LNQKTSRDIVSDDAGESSKQIQRFIRLTELIPTLLNLVDENKLAFNPSVAISYLNPEQQTWLEEIMTGNECSPSLSQAERLKQLSQEGKLDQSAMYVVMTEPKVQQPQIVIKQDRIAKFFPRDVTPQQMEETIMKLLEGWYRKRNQEVSDR
jgi:ParB family chromosome partitioning protein